MNRFRDLRKSLPIFLLLIVFQSVMAEKLYWVGGSGNFSDPAHWSLTSGGISANKIPGPSDYAYFDARSFKGQSIITFFGNIQVGDFVFAEATYPVILSGHSSSSLTVNGDLHLNQYVTWDYAGDLILKSPRPNSDLSFSHALIKSNIKFSGSGSYRVNSFTSAPNKKVELLSGTVILDNSSIFADDIFILNNSVLNVNEAVLSTENSLKIASTATIQQTGKLYLQANASDPSKFDLGGHNIPANQIADKAMACAWTFTITQQPTCPNSCNGSVSITVPAVCAGTTGPPYSAQWLNGCAPLPTPNPQLGLMPPVYTVSTVCGCANNYTILFNGNNGTGGFAGSIQFGMTNPSPMIADFDSIRPTCFGDCDGKIYLNYIINGTPPYSVNWGAGAPAPQPHTGIFGGDSITGLCVSGPSQCYTVTITDALGCPQSFTACISQPSQIIPNVTTSNPACNGVCSGTATANPSGGTPPYTVTWSNGMTGTSISGLCAPLTLTCTVTDANGCSDQQVVNLTQPTAVNANVVSHTNATCSDVCNGTATGTASGGTGALTPSWTPTPGGGQGTLNATGLCGSLAGTTYSLIVTDANGCKDTATVNITSPSEVLANVTTTQPLCSANPPLNLGSISSAPSGGTSGYSCTLNGVAMPGCSASGLVAGSYTVIVTDAAGCDDTSIVTLVTPPALTLSLVPTPPSCFNSTNGQICASVSGGTPGYSYSWNPPATPANSVCLTGLSGTTTGATVTVTDNNGCTITNNVAYTSPPQINPNVTVTQPTCNGSTNGTAVSNPSGGSGSGYTFSWTCDPGNTTNTTSGQGAGTCTLTVTDGSACSQTVAVVFVAPNPLTVTVSNTNLTCATNCNAQITTSVNGGTPTYSYSWSGSGSGTTPNLVNQCAGNYIVTVTDANGCTANGSATVTSPPVLSVSLTGTNPLCASGPCNGSISSTISGGVAPYTISWNPNIGNNPNPTNLCAGSYTITVTDANGCQATANVTLTNPPAITATVATTSVLCVGACNGVATVTAGGGTPGYTYSWDNGAFVASNSISTLCAGTHTVVVQDANGCTFSTTFVIGQPLALSGSVSGINSSCATLCNGSATATALGGTSPYTYSWNGGPPSGSPIGTNLCSGSNSVVITDANGCTVTVNFTVPTAITIVINPAIPTSVSCFGGCDGTATATASGPNPPFVYVWTGPSGFTFNGQTPTNLCAGSYTVTVTDNIGCSASATVTLTNPPALNATTSQVNNVCFGTCVGSANVSPSGGTPPYSVSWSNGQTGNTATNLCVGSYTATITDSKGCQITRTFTIGSQSQITIASTITNPTTCGGTNGQILVTPSGGQAPYTLLWGNPPGGSANPLTNLSAGNYTLTITDALGCDSTVTFAVVDPVGPTTSSTQTNVSCFGQCTGSATVNATGTGPLIATWPSGGPSGPVPQSNVNLCAGTYNVMVQDGNNCISVETITITQPAQITDTPFVVTNPLCFGNSNGSINITAGGGTPGYTFTLNGNPATNPMTGLSAGTYTVVITDNLGCSRTLNYTLTNPPLLDVNATKTDVLCFGACTGVGNSSIVSGGTPPLSYNWTNSSASTVSILPSANLLCVGNYTLTVTDANGCQDVSVIVIAQPTDLVTNLTSTNNNCSTGCSGSGTTNPSGGVPPYSWQWLNSGQTTQNVSNLCPGSYSVIVTDANGCKDTVAFSVNPGPALNLTVSSTNVSCNAQCNGTATASPSGGNPGGYTYSWAPNGSTSQTALNLCAGNYTVNVSDPLGCVVSQTVSVTQPNPLLNNLTAVNPTCNGQCNGIATATPLGGTSPYTTVWNGTTTGSFINNLCAGTYTAVTTDANGCKDSTTINVVNPPAVNLLASTAAASCGSCNGSITLSNITGTGSVTINWLTPSSCGTSTTCSNLCAGIYQVELTDQLNCKDTFNIPITNSNGPLITTNTVNDSCFNSCTGLAAVTSTTGNGPFTYSWNTTPITVNDTASGLCAGAYIVTVIDALNCSTLVSLNIGQPTQIQNVAVISQATCAGINNGSISNTASGGTPGYQYSLNGGPLQASGNFTNLAPGTYTLTVVDANNCSQQFTYSITPATQILSQVSSSNINCFGTCNGAATLNNIGGGTAPYTISWNDPNGQSGLSAVGLCAGTYTGLIIDAMGCRDSQTVVITAPSSPIVPNASIVSPACGQCNGSVTLAPSGGSPAYSYVWGTGATTAAITNVCAGIYQVNITDANGCVVTHSVSINNAGGPGVTATSTNAGCNGNCNGTASVTALGGTAPYTYFWVPVNQSTAAISNLCPGIYFVQVKDANNCVTNDSVTIISSPAIVANQTVTPTSCGACNGVINTNPSGGSGSGYTYNWNGPSGALPSTQNQSGLCAGSYTLVVTDGSGCSDTMLFTINSTNGPGLTLSTTDVDCNGSSNGSATVVISGGQSPYTVSWSTGASGTSVSGLSPGNYAVTVTDNLGCVTVNNFSISQPNLLALSLTNTQLPSCSGVCNGVLTAIPSGGTMPYSYVWSLGTSVSDTMMNLCAGNYSVTVTDANGCSANQPIVLINNPVLISPNANIGAPSCGQCNGTISLSPTGGNSPYTYSWNTGATTNSLSNVCAGVYQVMVTDNLGCQQNIPITVSSANAPVIAVASTNIPCHGSCTGSASVSISSGGIPPFTYFWPVGGQTTSSINNQCAGTYFVQVTDSANCVATQSLTITEPGPFAANAFTTQPACGSCNGAITTNITGGTTPYTLSWNTGATTPNLTNLCAGSYTLAITDGNGCQDTIIVGLNSNAGPSISVNSANELCAGDCQGTAAVTITGGTLPVVVNWSNGSSSTSLSSLCPGVYVVTVTDNASCVQTASVSIGSPNPLILSLPTVIQPLCNNDCNGQINVLASGGTTPYTYVWVPVQSPSGPTAVNLCSGNYSVTVTDANGCSLVELDTLINPAILVVSGVTTGSSCNTVPDGGITTTVSGGTPGYTYSWNNGQTTSGLTNVLSGTYTLVVTDNNNCTDTSTYTIIPGIDVQVDAGNDTSFCESGGITLNGTVSGATTFSWIQLPSGTVIATTNTVSLTPSTGVTQYVFTANNNGCVNSDTISVTSNPLPNVNAGPDVSIVNGQAVVIGGSPTTTTNPSVLSWTPNINLSATNVPNPTASPTLTTTYVVSVTDTNGCFNYDTMIVTILPSIIIPNGFTPNGDGKNDTWMIDYLYKFPNCEVEVYNRWGEQLFYSRGYNIPWDGNYKGKPVPVGTYYYIIRLNDPIVNDTYTGPLTILR